MLAHRRDDVRELGCHISEPSGKHLDALAIHVYLGPNPVVFELREHGFRIGCHPFDPRLDRLGFLREHHVYRPSHLHLEFRESVPSLRASRLHDHAIIVRNLIGSLDGLHVLVGARKKRLGDRIPDGSLTNPDSKMAEDGSDQVCGGFRVRIREQPGDGVYFAFLAPGSLEGGDLF